MTEEQYQEVISLDKRLKEMETKCMLALKEAVDLISDLADELEYKIEVEG